MVAMTPANKATMLGLAAPVLWGMSVGLIRSITQDFGIGPGLTLLYTLAVLMLLPFFGLPKLNVYPKKYLIFGIGSANLCSICFAFSLAMSDGGRQTMEVGMVNYLWPCMTVIFAILFNGQKARWWVAIGFILCLVGIATVLGGDEGLSFSEISQHMSANPWSYLLALIGAIAWAGYSSMTRAWANGQNPTILIFALDAVIFAIFWACGVGADVEVNSRGWLGAVMAAVATGSGYAAWNVGMMKGNMTLLAIASYFTPVLSCLFASVWIGAVLTGRFWQGVALVVLGSMICWLATRFAVCDRTQGVPKKFA